MKYFNPPWLVRWASHGYDNWSFAEGMDTWLPKTAWISGRFYFIWRPGLKLYWSLRLATKRLIYKYLKRCSHEWDYYKRRCLVCGADMQCKA